MKIIQLIIQFFTNIFKTINYRKLTKTLVEGAKKKNKDRLNLEFLIAKYIKKFRKKSKSNTSEYIPLSFMEKQRIKYLLEQEFGDQMKQLNVRLNTNLQLV